ncbi:MAG: undecaprenyl-diphosphate phosphatase [Planctomycetota bacterium]
MKLLDALLLGIVQGLTEFLPVSSSGHLALLQSRWGYSPEQSTAFSVVLHLGTLLAVVVAYRRSLLALLSQHRAALWPLALGTAPLVLVVPVKDYVDRVAGSPTLLGLAFFFTAGLLVVADAPWRAREPEPAPEDGEAPAVEAPAQGVARLSPPLALAIGFAQAFAVIPGISRSGSTISAAMLGRVKPVVAAEFSFLLAIPAILGAGVLEARKIQGLAQENTAALLLGFSASALTGVLAIVALKWLLRRRRFWVFAPYLVILGALTVWGGASG